MRLVEFNYSEYKNTGLLFLKIFSFKKIGSNKENRKQKRKLESNKYLRGQKKYFWMVKEC